MSDQPLSQDHFVLVHGGCHGAWCWDKLSLLLQNAGHHVTALDMAASGMNKKRIDQIQTLRYQTEPLIELMASLPNGDKVILVGHSSGGLNLSVVMEMFPHKIEVAVFVSAFMPDTPHTPSFIFDQFAATCEANYWLDTEFKSSGDPKETLTTMLFGPQFLSKLYHLSPVEDFELAMTLKRPSSLFLHDVWKPESKLSAERYGSVRRVYVVCEEDRGIPQSFQRWMAENSGLKEVKELKGADHMPMFCMPQKLCDCLVEIANK